jgi:hypothetical protein
MGNWLNKIEMIAVKLEKYPMKNNFILIKMGSLPDLIIGKCYRKRRKKKIIKIAVKLKKLAKNNFKRVLKEVMLEEVSHWLHHS